MNNKTTGGFNLVLKPHISTYNSFSYKLPQNYTKIQCTQILWKHMDFDIPISQLGSLRILRLKEKAKYATSVCWCLFSWWYLFILGRQIFVIFTCFWKQAGFPFRASKDDISQTPCGLRSEETPTSHPSRCGDPATPRGGVVMGRLLHSSIWFSHSTQHRATQSVVPGKPVPKLKKGKWDGNIISMKERN